MAQISTITIGIPYYNRPKLIYRCLNSIAKANSGNRICALIFDDGSPEELIIKKKFNFVVQIIRSQKNVGVCEGRRALLEAATSELFMILDSDDTIPEDFLQNIDEAFTDELDGVLFKCKWDDNTLSPAVDFPDGTFTLATLIEFIDRNPTKRVEWRSVVRTNTKNKVNWPHGHRKMERYHLDLVKNYRIEGNNKVIRNYHGDAEDQISKTGMHGDKTHIVTSDRVLGVIELFNDFGTILAKHGPKRYLHQKLFLLTHMHKLRIENVIKYKLLREEYPEYFCLHLRLASVLLYYLNKVRRKSRWLWPI